jgi:putative membrane protein
MKLLILCVDRDDDLGTKAGVTTPVIGREDSLKAAMELGLADPEESDTNSILSGISIYDDYVKSGVDCEVAVICGNRDVGIKSDQALAAQLDIVLAKLEPTSAILVSDGAEDEFIYPILSSRIHIDAIKRVIVKQSRNIESLYYMIARSIQDEKVRRKFVLPVALALIVFSTFFMLTQIANAIYPGDPVPDISWAVVFLTIGFYIIVKAYNLDEPIRAMSSDAKTAISTIPFVMLAGVTVVAGVLAAWNGIQDPEITDPRHQILVLSGILLWACVFAIILLGMGRALQVFSKEGEFPWVFFPMVFSILAFGSFMYGILVLSSYLLGFVGPGVIDDIFIFWTIGFFFAILGYFAFGSIKHPKPMDWQK